MGDWINNDGLYIKYGQKEAVPTIGGNVPTDGALRSIEFDLDLTTLTSTDGPILDNVVIPTGAIITKVIVTVRKVTAGTNSNLDLGLAKLDRTQYDWDGLIAVGDDWHAAAQGTITEYVQGSTEHGAALGIATTEPTLIAASWDTGAFTDGILNIVIEYLPAR